MALHAASALALAPVQGQHPHAPRADGGYALQPYLPCLTIYPDLGHNSWDPAYDDPALHLWPLEQRRPANNKDKR